MVRSNYGIEPFPLEYTGLNKESLLAGSFKVVVKNRYTTMIETREVKETVCPAAIMLKPFVAVFEYYFCKWKRNLDVTFYSNYRVLHCSFVNPFQCKRWDF